MKDDKNFYKMSNARKYVISLQTKVRLVVGGVWLFGPVYSLAFTLPTTTIINGFCAKVSVWPSPAAKTAYGYVNLVTQFVLPFILIIFFYIRLFNSIRKRSFAVDDISTTATRPATCVDMSDNNTQDANVKVTQPKTTNYGYVYLGFMVIMGMVCCNSARVCKAIKD